MLILSDRAVGWAKKGAPAVAGATLMGGKTG